MNILCSLTPHRSLLGWMVRQAEQAGLGSLSVKFSVLICTLSFWTLPVWSSKILSVPSVAASSDATALLLDFVTTLAVTRLPLSQRNNSSKLLKKWLITYHILYYSCLKDIRFSFYKNTFFNALFTYFFFFSFDQNLSLAYATFETNIYFWKTVN